MKVYQNLKKAIAFLFLFLWLFIQINLLVTQNFVSQITKRDFALPNVALLCIGIATVVLVSVIGIWLYRRYHAQIEKLISFKMVVLLSVLLFFFQLYLSYHVYFITDWDVQLVINNATLLNQGEVSPDFPYYYSRYPNNLFLTYLYALIMKVGAWLGMGEGNVFSIVAVQCAISAVTAYLTYRVTYSFTNSKWMSLFAYAVYAVFIGVSPWFVIPYSDATGLVFPIAIFRMWQIAKKTERRSVQYVLYAVMGVLAFIGFKIKPQILIVFIALLMIVLIKTLLVLIKERRAWQVAARYAACLGAFVLSAALFSGVISMIIPQKLDPEREYGMAHFLMMGLNEERQGIYSDEDVAFSASFETKEERSAANLEVVRQRLREMGIGGLFKHLVNKTLVNFGDGSFAWHQEGIFLKEILPEKDENLSPFFRSFYYANGKNYGAFLTYSQYIWMAILFFAAFSAIYAVKSQAQKGDEMSVLLLALIGLTLFETLFEARARYLFTYAPIFIVCAVVGLYVILKAVRKKANEKSCLACHNFYNVA